MRDVAALEHTTVNYWPISPFAGLGDCCSSLCESRCCSFLNCPEKQEQLLMITLNALRDAIWVYFSYSQFDVKLQHTQDASFGVDSQWLGQEVYSTLGMLLFSAACRAAYFCKGRPFPTTTVCALNAAASVGIYAFDRFGTWGAQLGQSAVTLTVAQAGYFAALFTAFETPVQTLIITLVKLLTQNSEWSQLYCDPVQYLKIKIKELGLSMTIGLLPGAVWQLVFNAGVVCALGPVGTALLVATAAAMSNLIYVTASTVVSNSSCCYTPPAPLDTANTYRAPLTWCCSFFPCVAPDATQMSLNNSASASSIALMPNAQGMI